jgi:spermidine/putrescine transport system ATP-binding protein
MPEVKVKLINVVKEFAGRERAGSTRAVDNVSFQIYDGEFFAMLGPSGCGKTTTLRLIAGFEQPTSGSILIDDVPMQGVPAHQRPVNTVFQDYVLFPHMSVLQNVMFGLEMAGVARKEAQKRAHEALEMVRLPHLAQRRPKELSGGQQQRVALARALVNRPSVLLLDEPLGALDLKLRRDMQTELKAMQAEVGITFIYVTHDQEEALTMADRIAVMEGGRVLQIGTPSDIYETPGTRFVADFIGETNFIEGTLTHTAGTDGVLNIGDEVSVPVRLPYDDLAAGQAVTLAIRPERIQLRDQQDADHAPDVVSVLGQIEQVQYIGTDTRYTVRIGHNAVKVRVQNTDYEKSLVFKNRQFVRAQWHLASARILLE